MSSRYIARLIEIYGDTIIDMLGVLLAAIGVNAFVTIGMGIAVMAQMKKRRRYRRKKRRAKGDDSANRHRVPFLRQ